MAIPSQSAGDLSTKPGWQLNFRNAYGGYQRCLLSSMRTRSVRLITWSGVFEVLSFYLEEEERRKGGGGKGGGIRLNLGASKDRLTFLAESVELIDPLFRLSLEALPRVPRETGHRDECSELRHDDGDGRGVGPQVVVFQRGGARHPFCNCRGQFYTEGGRGGENAAAAAPRPRRPPLVSCLSWACRVRFRR